MGCEACEEWIKDFSDERREVRASDGINLESSKSHGYNITPLDTLASCLVRSTVLPYPHAPLQNTKEPHNHHEEAASGIVWCYSLKPRDDEVSIRRTVFPFYDSGPETLVCKPFDRIEESVMSKA